jgi:hypothetical protein
MITTLSNLFVIEVMKNWTKDDRVTGMTPMMYGSLCRAVKNVKSVHRDLHDLDKVGLLSGSWIAETLSGLNENYTD